MIKNIFLVWALKIKFPNVSTVGSVGCWRRGYYKRMGIDNIEELLIVSLDRDSKSDSDGDSSRLNNTPLLLHVQSETSPLQNIMSSYSHTPFSEEKKQACLTVSTLYTYTRL